MMTIFLSASDNDCTYNDPKGEHYLGRKTGTENGYKCGNWTGQVWFTLYSSVATNRVSEKFMLTETKHKNLSVNCRSVNQVIHRYDIWFRQILTYSK